MTTSANTPVREIKFRAWDKSNEEMLDGYSWSMFGTGHIIEDDKKNLILMQYTGLKDKNGTEIYEGDILKTTGTADKNVFVIYQAPEFVVKWKTEKGNDSSAWSEIIYHLVKGKAVSFYEVIGNIMENPELLK